MDLRRCRAEGARLRHDRTQETSTPFGGGIPETDILGYPATSNRVVSVTRDNQTVRAFTYDAAGNMLTDSTTDTSHTYTYNKANRLKTVDYQGNLVGTLTYTGTYTYNGFHQLIQRAVTSSGTGAGTTRYVHDLGGNIIAEATTLGATVREYIWLPEAEIAPAMSARAQVDRPVAVVDAVNTGSPQLWYARPDAVWASEGRTNDSTICTGRFG